MPAAHAHLAMARTTSFKLVMRHFTLPANETRRWMAAAACGLRRACRASAIRRCAFRRFISLKDIAFIGDTMLCLSWGGKFRGAVPFGGCSVERIQNRKCPMGTLREVKGGLLNG